VIALIDIGNTRFKWALAENLGAVRSVAHVAGLDAAITALVEALPRTLRRVLAANVAGGAVGARLAAALRERHAIETEFVTPEAERYGIRCAYADPERLGVDRWLAMIAAHRSTAGLACVIQAGTAVTFDAVDAAGRHLGGLIFPGARLMADALERNTGRIGPTAALARHVTGLNLLGTSTDEGVGKGSMLALAAALDRAVAAVAGAMHETPSVILTGGDADELAPWLESEVRFSADLVLTGLAHIARHDE
jgi:type III pantothenate kinase